MTWTEYGRHRVWRGETLDMLRALPDGCADAVFTDPPYPEVSRPYGRWSEDDWLDLMRAVIREAARVLRPSGSAVFVVKPGSESVGRMRPALYTLAAEAARGELVPGWGIVQDAYWWNHATPPGGCGNRGGLRQSVAWLLWIGPARIYRDQSRVLIKPTDRCLELARETEDRYRGKTTSGHGSDRVSASKSATERGGATPFNLLPMANAASDTSGGGAGHSASTPHDLTAWWLRYLVPRGGTVIDPFLGSGTTMIEADAGGLTCIGAERFEPHWDIIDSRWTDAGSGSALNLFGASK